MCINNICRGIMAIFCAAIIIESVPFFEFTFINICMSFHEQRSSWQRLKSISTASLQKDFRRNKCPGYYIKQSYSEAPLILKLSGIESF